MLQPFALGGAASGQLLLGACLASSRLSSLLAARLHTSAPQAVPPATPAPQIKTVTVTVNGRTLDVAEGAPTAPFSCRPGLLPRRAASRGRPLAILPAACTHDVQTSCLPRTQTHQT